MRIVVSDLANDDPETTYDYLSARSPATATTFIAEINRVFADLVLFPKIGRQRSDLRPSLRSQPVGNQIVFYKLVGDDIVVVRILDGRMNIDRDMFP